MPYTVFNFNAENVQDFIDSVECRITLATLYILGGKPDLCHFCKILLGERQCYPALFHYIFQFHGLT